MQLLPRTKELSLENRKGRGDKFWDKEGTSGLAYSPTWPMRPFSVTSKADPANDSQRLRKHFLEIANNS